MNSYTIERLQRVEIVELGCNILFAYCFAIHSLSVINGCAELTQNDMFFNGFSTVSILNCGLFVM